MITKAIMEDKDKGMAYHAIIGVLFLVRKSIRGESIFLNDKNLLPEIEKQLKLSGINPDSDDKIYLNALRNFLETHYELLSNEILKIYFHSTDSKKIHVRPTDLTPYRIKLFQDLLKKYPVKNNFVLKLRKKDTGLSYSILKYPGDEGFYLIDSGKNATLESEAGVELKTAIISTQMVTEHLILSPLKWKIKKILMTLAKLRCLQKHNRVKKVTFINREYGMTN